MVITLLLRTSTYWQYYQYNECSHSLTTVWSMRQLQNIFLIYDQVMFFAYIESTVLMRDLIWLVCPRDWFLAGLLALPAFSLLFLSTHSLWPVVIKCVWYLMYRRRRGSYPKLNCFICFRAYAHYCFTLLNRAQEVYLHFGIVYLHCSAGDILLTANHKRWGM